MATVQTQDDWLRVAFDPKRHADFHFRWLRHNCDVDRHPVTAERTVCSSDLPDDLRVTEARIDNENQELVVRWAHDARESRYLLSWLDEHAYARDRVAPERPLSDVVRVTVRGDTLDVASVVARAIALVRSEGAAVVRRPSAKPEDETETWIDAFAKAGLEVIGTHFGRIEDLRTDNVTNANTDQLGYTDAPVDLHTDQPFLEKPPRMQLLQCIRPAETGGDNYLVDAKAAAEYLESVDAETYALLTNTVVRFHRKQKGFEKVLESPILSRPGVGSDFQVRYSYFTLAPYRYDFNRMEAWYRAHDRFARFVRDERNQLRFGLGPGDFVLYDNYRMLHARTGFRGARWLRGVYFD